MLPIPLCVEVKTSRTWEHITNRIRDLSFREVAVGGWASARFSLDAPLTFQPDEIQYYGRIRITDARHAGVVWEGRLEDPGAGADGSGQIWDLTAMGPSAHAKDTSVPLWYVDTRAEPWRVGGAGGSSRHVSVSTVGESTPTIVMKLGNGSVFSNGDAGLVVHAGLNEAGMELARVSVDWDGGTASSNLRVRLSTAALPAASAERVAADLNTTGGTLTTALGGTLPTGEDAAFLRFVRITSNLTVADETIWAEFSNFVVRARLKDADGTNHSGYSSNTVTADLIVNDLLGRLLDQYDGANAVVTATSHAIDQLVYPDAVTPWKVLEDLLELEPAMRWGAYESNAAGKARFEFIPWPTTVRYEATAEDGIDLPGSAEGLYNRVRVRFVNSNNQRKTIERTAAVPELDDQGLTRTAPLDLGDEVGSTANAQRAGDEFLAEHSTPPSGGRLTVARPVLDLIDGRMVMPWEMKAGELIRVRNVMPRSASLTAGGRDGVSVFRVASKDYSTAQAAATLELDQYSLSTSRALAELTKARTGRRRR